MTKNALILAAGKGTRMKRDIPKCIFPILKKPMIEYILEEIEASDIENSYVVVGHKKDDVKNILKDRVVYVDQDEQLGTAHAVMQARPFLEDKEGSTLIMLGDMPLINQVIINKIIKRHEENKADLTVVTSVVANPKGYGRIIRDNEDTIKGIVEELSCTPEQKNIREINTGIYAVKNNILFNIIDRIKKDPLKGEYYLTDIVKLMVEEFRVSTFKIRNESLIMGVNDLHAISIAEKHFREQINRNFMLEGVSMINPETITIGHEVDIAPGVIIYPNTTITGLSKIEANAEIGPNTELHNAIIKEDVTVKHSIIYNSIVEARTTVGPFAHLRDGAHIGQDNRIGNFVEVKKSTTQSDTKASHLAYIGDSVVGHNVNFGAGSITVNYDGVNKHQTTIGDNVFIGCNTNLVAPVTVESNVFIAAGSTVTKDIPSGSLTIARNQQINKADYYKNLIKPKKD